MHKLLLSICFYLVYVYRQGDNMTYKNNMRYKYDTLNNMNLCMIYL